MNRLKDGEELRLLCHERDEEGEKVKLLWEAKATIIPTYSFPNDSEAEENGDHLLDVEGVGVEAGIGAVGSVYPMENPGGENLKNQ